MPFCSNCGIEIVRTMKFCPECGHPLMKSQSEESEVSHLHGEHKGIGTQRSDKSTLRTALIIVSSFLLIMGRLTISLYTAIGIAFYFCGAIMWFYGLYLWVNLKNRDSGWVLLGLFWYIGLIIIALLEDRSLSPYDRLRCLSYLQQDWPLKKLMDEAQNEFIYTLEKYEVLRTEKTLDTKTAKRIVDAAEKLHITAEDVNQRRATITKIPEVAMTVYLTCNTVYSNCAKCATALQNNVKAMSVIQYWNITRECSLELLRAYYGQDLCIGDWIHGIVDQQRVNLSKVDKEYSKIARKIKLTSAELSEILDFSP